MTEKNKGLVKGILLLSIVVLAIYTIGYKRWENADFTDDIDYSEYMEKPQLQENDFNIEKAKTIYQRVNFKMIEENFGEEFADMYYNQKKFSNEFIIYLAVVDLNKDTFRIECNNEITISKADLDKKIKELFGSYIKYEDKSFNTKNNKLSIKYSNETNIYTINNYACSGIEYGKGHIETKIKNANLVNNILEIEEYVYYLDYEKNSDGMYVLKYYNSLNNNGPLIKEEDLDKVNTYKLILERDTSGNYSFQKIEKMTSK